MPPSITQSLPYTLKTLRILAILFTATLFGSTTAADEPIIVIEEARINAAKQSGDTEAYMQIINYSERGYIRLLSASSTLSTHTQLTKTDSLIINAGEALHLAPNNHPIQLRALNKQLISGDTVTLRLRFAHSNNQKGRENISEYDIETTIVKPGTHLHEDESGDTVSHANHD